MNVKIKPLQGPLYGQQITETEVSELGVGLLASIFALKRQVQTGSNEHGESTNLVPGHESDPQSDSCAESDEYWPYTQRNIFLYWKISIL